MTVDLILNYEDTKKMSNDDIMKLLDSKFPKRKLYRFGTSWRDDSQYILKARGTDGDVIVGWE